MTPNHKALFPFTIDQVEAMSYGLRDQNAALAGLNLSILDRQRLSGQLHPVGEDQVTEMIIALRNHPGGLPDAPGGATELAGEQELAAAWGRYAFRLGLLARTAADAHLIIQAQLNEKVRKYVNQVAEARSSYFLPAPLNRERKQVIWPVFLVLALYHDKQKKKRARIAREKARSAGAAGTAAAPDRSLAGRSRLLADLPLVGGPPATQAPIAWPAPTALPAPLPVQPVQPVHAYAAPPAHQAVTSPPLPVPQIHQVSPTGTLPAPSPKPAKSRQKLRAEADRRAHDRGFFLNIFRRFLFRPGG